MANRQFAGLFEKVLLEKIRIRSKGVISQAIIDTMRLSAAVDYTADYIAQNFIWGLEASILGQDLGEVIFEAPVDWWEAFKDRWFPKFLKKRYPVRMRRIHANQKVAYPNLSEPQLPNEQQWYIIHPQYTEFYEKVG